MINAQRINDEANRIIREMPTDRAEALTLATVLFCKVIRALDVPDEKAIEQVATGLAGIKKGLPVQSQSVLILPS